MICEWNLLFWRLDLAYFREKKDLSFDDLAGPVKQMAIPQHGPKNKLAKLYNHGHKISKRFTETDYSKAHTHSKKLAICNDICQLLSFSSTSLAQITVVSLADLHKRPEALAHYYVTSYWQAEWVKKLQVENNRVTFPRHPWITWDALVLHAASLNCYCSKNENVCMCLMLGLGVCDN